MKSLFIILVLSIGFVHAQRVTIAGQSGASEWVYWGHATDSSLKPILFDDDYYRDSSGTYVITDSCSLPFQIATPYGVHPVWLQELEARVRSAVADSGAVGVSIETRNVKNYTNKSYFGWRKKGFLAGTLNNAVQDTVALISPTGTDKVTVAAQFSVTGGQARACLYPIADTGNDTVFVDSVVVRRQ